MFEIRPPNTKSLPPAAAAAAAQLRKSFAHFLKPTIVPMRLHDKVVIVTGSCTGIGKAIALRCVAEGARVVVHGLEQDMGEAVLHPTPNTAFLYRFDPYQVLAAAGADNAALLIADLMVESTAQQLVDLAVATFGKLDAVVNNAALITQVNEPRYGSITSIIYQPGHYSHHRHRLSPPHAGSQHGCTVRPRTIRAPSSQAKPRLRAEYRECKWLERRT